MRNHWFFVLIAFSFIFFFPHDAKAETGVYIWNQSLSGGIADGAGNFYIWFQFDTIVNVTKFDTTNLNGAGGEYINITNGTNYTFYSALALPSTNYTPNVILNPGLYALAVHLSGGNIGVGGYTVPFYPLKNNVSGENSTDYVRLHVNATGPNSCGGQAGKCWFSDYLELVGNPSLTNTRTLTSQCQIDRTNTSVDIGTPLTCEIPDIDISNCINITKVIGTVTPKFFPTGSCGGLFPSEYFGNVTTYFNFNTTNTQQAYTTKCFLPFFFPDATITFPLTPATDNPNSYLGKDFASGSCLYTNDNANFSAQTITCAIGVTCTVNVTASSCNQQCFNGRLFFNGSVVNGQCGNFASSSPCPTGFCGSDSSCQIIELVDANAPFSGSPTYNTTSAGAKVFKAFFSLAGGTTIVILVISALIMRRLTEMLAVYFISGAFLLTSFFGLVPATMGLPLSAISFLLNKFIEDDE